MGAVSLSVLKTLKRSIAAELQEYSWEMSVKVCGANALPLSVDFDRGGPAGYGLRRQLIGREPAPKGLLSLGERKSLHTDHVILVPGARELPVGHHRATQARAVVR